MTPRRTTAVAATVALLVASAGIAARPAAAADTVAATQVQAGEWWLSKLNIRQAWAASKQGDGVKVGVYDSGVDGSQPDLRGAVVGGKDFSGGLGSPNGQQPIGESDGGVVFTKSHGTTMAGYIAGRGHGSGNKLGMLGVAPKADILTASIGPDSFKNSDPGIRWLADQGVKVINISLGGSISATDIAYAQAKDVVIVAATGNDSFRSMPAPARYPGVVAVSGIDEDLASDSRSNYRKPSFPSSDLTTAASEISGGVAVAGPMADEESDDPADGMVAATLDGYTRKYGTSNSAAVVSGIVALIRAAHPELNANDTVNRLIRTARQVNPAGVGISEAKGFGIPDAYAAVTKDFPATCENILGSLAPPATTGVWPSVFSKTPYVPKCQTGASSSAAPSSSPATSPSSSNEAIPSGSSDSSSGVPVWVWPVAAVVVLAVIGGAVLSRRGRRAAG